MRLKFKYRFCNVYWVPETALSPLPIWMTKLNVFVPVTSAIISKKKIRKHPKMDQIALKAWWAVAVLCLPIIIMHANKHYLILLIFRHYFNGLKRPWSPLRENCLWHHQPAPFAGGSCSWACRKLSWFMLGPHATIVWGETEVYLVKAATGKLQRKSKRYPI